MKRRGRREKRVQNYRNKDQEFCDMCGISSYQVPMTDHHVHKRCIFGENNNIVRICRKCHDIVELVVRKKEHAILHRHKTMYEQAYEQAKNGKANERDKRDEVRRANYRRENSGIEQNSKYDFIRAATAEYSSGEEQCTEGAMTPD